MQFLALSCGIDFDAQTAAICGEPKKARIVGKSSPSFLSVTRQCRNQLRAFDDEIRPGQGDLGRAAIGEQLESTNLIYDTLRSGRSELVAELIGDDKRASRRFKAGPGFQHANFAPAAGDRGCRKESRCGPSDNDDLASLPNLPGLLFSAWHDFAFPSRAYTPNLDSAGCSRSTF
jgi:hypothetical protein